MSSPKDFVLVITGPTGVGKTEIAFLLACKLKDVEIISCDSMAIYKEMNIGTSKPSEEMRRQIPHHLIDIVSVKEEFNVAKYVKLAKELIKDIIQRGKIPLIVGGSTMYLYSLIDGIFEGVPKDPGLREKLMQRAKEEGLHSLYKELEKIDPLTAQKVHPNDLKRIIRALEVYYKSGIPISKLKEEKEGIASQYDIIIYGLKRQRQNLYERIDTRVDEMIKRGLVEEVRKLWEEGIGPTAFQGHGYKEIIGYLEGKYDLNEAIRLTKRNTRRYAKRQLSWLKRDKRLTWINLDEFRTQEEVVNFILEDLRRRGKL
jgi:tRNA dimethylallyltransferase